MSTLITHKYKIIILTALLAIGIISLRNICDVVVTVEYNEEQCSNKYPLYIKIINNSWKVVERVEWKIKAQREGHSDDMTEGAIGNLWSKPYSDKILKPGETWSTCENVEFNRKYNWVDGSADRIVYSIKDKVVNFK